MCVPPINCFSPTCAPMPPIMGILAILDVSTSALGTLYNSVSSPNPRLPSATLSISAFFATFAVAISASANCLAVAWSEVFGFAYLIFAGWYRFTSAGQDLKISSKSKAISLSTYRKCEICRRHLKTEISDMFFLVRKLSTHSKNSPHWDGWVAFVRGNDPHAPYSMWCNYIGGTNSVGTQLAMQGCNELCGGGGVRRGEGGREGGRGGEGCNELGEGCNELRSPIPHDDMFIYTTYTRTKSASCSRSRKYRR